MKSNRERNTWQVVFVAAQVEGEPSNAHNRPAILHRAAVSCLRYLAIATFVTVVVGGFPAMALKF
jgi:hypothetical protein